jgi:hypothetical protein
MKRLAFAAVVSVLLASPPVLAKKYAGPAPGVPSAAIHMVTNHEGSFSFNTYWICADAACERNKGGTKLAHFSWATGSQRSVLVAVDKPLRIMASYGRVIALAGTPERIVADSGIPCINTIEFTPVGGRTYELKQELDFVAMAAARKGVHALGNEINAMRNGAGCRIALVDAATGIEPAGLVRIGEEPPVTPAPATIDAPAESPAEAADDSK